jgi:hypothetical protein
MAEQQLLEQSIRILSDCWYGNEDDSGGATGAFASYHEAKGWLVCWESAKEVILREYTLVAGGAAEVRDLTPGSLD